MKQGLQHYAILAALVAVASTTPAFQAKEKPPLNSGNKALDDKVYTTLHDVINRGADLYNGNDPAACYRLYEGSLITIRPLIDHRPDLQKAITEGIASAERDPLVWRRAFTLRNVIDQIRSETKSQRLVKDKFPAPSPDDKPLVATKKLKSMPQDKETSNGKQPDKKPEENKQPDKKPDEKKVNEEKSDPDTLPLPREEEKQADQRTEESKKLADTSGDDKLPFPRKDGK